MNITLLTLGKLKEQYLRDACAEYEKRLSVFGRINIVELSPVKLGESASAAEIENALIKEGELLLTKIPQSAYLIALCIEGKQMPSEGFAELFQKLANGGVSELYFVIGSSYGLSDRVKRIANQKMSMSEMTFPHQLARVMLLEQIYRASMINANKKYHK